MKNKIIFAVSMLALLGLVAADFVQTPLYFTIPVSYSFTVTTMSAQAYTSGTGAVYPLTDLYYFNSTTGWDTWKPVCTGGATPNCTTGNDKVPAFRYQATGSVNISIFEKLNATVPVGVKMCYNSTRTAGCPGTTQAVCTSQNLNDTQWAYIAQQLSPDGGTCSTANSSIYANFTAVAGGTYAIGLTHNSTAS